MPRILNVCLVLACGTATAAVSQSAFAGELKLFAQAPETDASGKLAATAKPVKELGSEPGEETWEVHLWAKIDKGAPGPLYAEFYGDLNGKKYLAQRFEKADYDGEKYVTWSIELDGNIGFNRNRTYQVEINQMGAKGNPIKFASSAITLKFTEEEKGADDDGGEKEEEGDDAAEPVDDQDVHDSFAGDDGGDGPPPVAPSKKKGCSVDPEPYGSSALLLMLALGAVTRRRR